MRSRTVSRPEARCRATFCGPPMAAAASRRRRISSISGIQPCPPGSARSPAPPTDASQCRDHTCRVILAWRPGVSVNDSSPRKLRHMVEGIMINELGDMPAGVIGFEASGRLRAEDYRDVILPALERGGGRRGPVRDRDARLRWDDRRGAEAGPQG